MRILLLKAQIKNGRGLHLEDRTDRTGRHQKKWVKGVEAKAPEQAQAKVGDKVEFQVKGQAAQGQVVAAGKDGATVKNGDGKEHAVYWHEMRRPAPATPDYAPREEGENDKAYAKRVVDKGESPEHLPEEPDRHFNTEGSTKVPIANLVSREEGLHMKAAEAAKDLAKSALPPEKYASLPSKASQPVNSHEELFKRGAEALDQLKDWLNRGKGLASQMGYQTMAKSPDDVSDAEWDKPGGMLFIAPLKGAERAREKVDKEYGGNWNQLSDVVRCTLAVDNLHDLSEALATLEKHGLEPAQIPKNKFLKPTPMGYMDMNFVIKMPNGMLAELQMNVKDMMKAKNVAHHDYEVTRKIEAGYTDEKTGDMTPKPEWSEVHRKEHAEAEAKQQQIYGDAWRGHVRKHYGSHETMAKSLRRVLLWRSR